jgi:hypothetical protein
VVAPTPTRWPLPAGWRTEIIPFPLQFAPGLAHRGAEELRFSPGFFDPAAPGYWSYAFAWRLEDPAELDASALASELTAYFRGLLGAVDQTHRLPIDQISVRAAPAGAVRFQIEARVLDAFTTGAAVELSGTASRRACGSGALWVFALAPPASGLRAQVLALADQAGCGQTPVARGERP